jgi:hypothetical protein
MRVEERDMWTPEMDAIALRMVGEGKSRTEVGKTLGKSRNAVIGRLHRLRAKGIGLPKQSPAGPRPRALRPSPAGPARRAPSRP